MWTLSLWTVIATGLFLLLAYALHRWGLVQRVSVHRDGILAWLKAKWDWAAAAVIALAPVIWSAGLDTFVIAANFLAGVFPALAGIDLSKLMISDGTRTWIQVGAAVLPLIRDAIEKVRK